MFEYHWELIILLLLFFFFQFLTDENPDNLKDKLQRLPPSLSKSVEALENDTVMRDLIGEKLITAVKGVRKVCLFLFDDVREV